MFQLLQMAERHVVDSGGHYKWPFKGGVSCLEMVGAYQKNMMNARFVRHGLRCTTAVESVIAFSGLRRDKGQKRQLFSLMKLN